MLHCHSCGRCLSPTYCLKKATTRYRYYRCQGATKKGARTCPAKTLPAAAIEQFMLDQIRALLGDRARLQAMQAALSPAAEPQAPDAVLAPARLRLVLDSCWERLPAAERTAVVGAWVERIDYDGVRGQVTITFRPAAVAALAQEETQSWQR